MNARPLEPTSPSDSAALREELHEVRRAVLAQWAELEHSSVGDIARVLVGVPALLLGLLLLPAGVDIYKRDADGVTAALLIVLGLLSLALAIRVLRPWVREQLAMWREVRRLRRRERQLVAQLPSGTAGPGSYRLWYRNTFGSPVFLVLYALAGVALLGPIVIRRL